MTTKQPQDRFITVNGLRLHYVEWGSQDLQPIILLHGGMAHARVWDNFAQAAQSLYRVLSVDQRGHGDSDRADDYSGQQHVSDVTGLIQQLDLNRPILMGHSMGGRNVIMFASQHPDVLDKLVIVDMAPEISPRMAESAQHNPRDPGVFDNEEEAVQFLRKRARYPSDDTLRNAIHYSLKPREDGRLIWKWDPAMRTRMRAPEPDMWPMLQAITCPTLVVRGKESPAIDPEVAQRMIHILPNSSLVEIEQAEHSVHEDNPKAFNQAILDFLGSGH